MKRVKKVVVMLMVSAICILCMACQKQNKEQEVTETKEVHVASLKGPTSLGLAQMIAHEGELLETAKYQYDMYVNADEILPGLLNGSTDIALIPSNVASVLYHKSEGAIQVININTLGVLYFVSADETIETIDDLKGKTIYLTGKGTTPDYVLQYLLDGYEISSDDVAIEYKSEATEVVAALMQNENAVGLLPQPFATVACMQDERLLQNIDCNEAWAEIAGDTSGIVTGVTVARTDFLQENEEILQEFLQLQENSVDYVNQQSEDAIKDLMSLGIVEKEPILVKALPQCNITFITGSKMKTLLNGYLQILEDKNSALIGGSLPADDFYYE